MSRRYRLNTARNYVTVRIEHWQGRNQLKPEEEEAEYLLHGSVLDLLFRSKLVDQIHND